MVYAKRSPPWGLLMRIGLTSVLTFGFFHRFHIGFVLRVVFLAVMFFLGCGLLKNERQPMFSAALDHYFDLAEHLALRASLLVFLLLALWRLIVREFRRR
jgi:Na+/H+-dicarboxylate symporter